MDVAGKNLQKEIPHMEVLAVVMSGWWMVKDSNFLPGAVLAFLKDNVYFYSLNIIIVNQLYFSF